ncbi:MAG: acyl-CoA reductase [Cyclobacteriaceae bacterium]|nr:acyl-CoA reductase [Cyclobacteriaceae bacterium]
MKLTQRIEALSQLGKVLNGLSKEKLLDWADKAGNENRWFTQESVAMAISGISKMLKKDALTSWAEAYTLNSSVKRIGIVMAGNIPLVGFHDLLSVLISGNKAVIKLSSQDKVLMPLLTDLLISIEQTFEDQIEYVGKLEHIDAVIATGSDNSARYFKQYFGKQPHIIRKNRTSCAVLKGDETDEDIIALGKDIFSYFGLGCRNVSKLYVPKEYDFISFLDVLNAYKDIAFHSKWVNNYDYNKSIYLVNREPHLDTGFLLLKESSELVSPLAVLFYEVYTDTEALKSRLEINKDKIQCIIGSEANRLDCIPFGEGQYPEVLDYADGVDTLKFLTEI